MTAPRRRLIRPDPPSAPSAVERQREKLRIRLEQERAALTRWFVRLKRAFHAVEKQQRCVARLERTFARQEG